MPGIFISYRREDSAGWTGRLVGQLKERFGADHIFSDIDTIEPGANFTEAITRAVGSCNVLLAIIGPRWLTETDTSKQRRLDDPADWVRTEIAAALSRKIRVIPVLVGTTSMPAAVDLPTPLASLAERNALRLSDENWDDQVARLTEHSRRWYSDPSCPHHSRSPCLKLRLLQGPRLARSSASTPSERWPSRYTCSGRRRRRSVDYSTRIRCRCIGHSPSTTSPTTATTSPQDR